MRLEVSYLSEDGTYSVADGYKLDVYNDNMLRVWRRDEISKDVSIVLTSFDKVIAIYFNNELI
jgi:hypothetical protein